MRVLEQLHRTKIRIGIGLGLMAVAWWVGLDPAVAGLVLIGDVEQGAPPAGGGDPAPPQGPPSGSLAPPVDPTAGNQNPAATAAGMSDEAFAERVRREGWVPRHAASRMAERYRALERAQAESQTRIRALAGVEPQADPQVEQFRDAMLQLFPQLGEMTPQRMQRLIQLIDGGEIDSVLQARDVVFGRTAWETASNAARQWMEATGKDPSTMTPQQVDRIGRELQRFIEADSEGGRARRYERGDQTLLKEFVDDLTGFYGGPPPAPAVDPATGQPAATPPTPVQQVRRVGQLPRTGPRTGPGPGTTPTRLERGKVSEAARQAALERLGGS